MFVPDPVISLAIKPTGQETPSFSRALNRFQKEDPTFRVHIDAESQEVRIYLAPDKLSFSRSILQTIISGMGELHLDIYVERMKREYNVACTTGKPRVAFREAIKNKSDFSDTHKKETGGAGQFGRVIGYVEPMTKDEETGKDIAFESLVTGGNIPAGYIPACEQVYILSLWTSNLGLNLLSLGILGCPQKGGTLGSPSVRDPFCPHGRCRSLCRLFRACLSTGGIWSFPGGVQEGKSCHLGTHYGRRGHRTSTVSRLSDSGHQPAPWDNH